MSQSNNDSEEH